jgi:ankyrin repeat protein
MDDLLAHGVPVDVPHPLRQTTALMEATRLGRTTTVHWLLVRGATPAFLCGKPRATPLHLALRTQQWVIAELLVNASKDVTAMDEHGCTPMHILSMSAGPHAPEETIMMLATRLIERNAPLDELDDEGVSALHYAVLSDMTRLVELLLAHGTNPNIAANGTGITPLAIAALEKNMNIAALLMQYGANPHQPSHDGVTPAATLPAITRMAAGVPSGNVKPMPRIDGKAFPHKNTAN